MSYDSSIPKEGSNISTVAYPVSPEISDVQIKEIADLEIEILAPGIMVARNAFDPR